MHLITDNMGENSKQWVCEEIITLISKIYHSFYDLTRKIVE